MGDNLSCTVIDRSHLNWKLRLKRLAEAIWDYLMLFQAFLGIIVGIFSLSFVASFGFHGSLSLLGSDEAIQAVLTISAAVYFAGLIIMIKRELVGVMINHGRRLRSWFRWRRTLRQRT